MDYNRDLSGGENFTGAAEPFSPEAEQSVLGAVLLESSAMSTAATILPRAEFFYAQSNKLVYTAMLEMYTLGKPIDFITVLERLKTSEGFDEQSGKVYLTQLAQLVPSISNIEVYCNIVRDQYMKRVLIEAARGILNSAANGDAETQMLIDSAEQAIYDIRQEKNVRGLQPIGEILLETFDRLDKLNSPDRDLYKGLPTGIGQLDRTLTGLNRSDLIILAARPGMGKTSFALNIARHISMKPKRRVAFFSLEMSKEQLASRMLSAEARVDGTKLRSGDLNENEWTRIIQAGDLLSRASLYFDDTPGISVNDMKAKVRRLGDVGLIIIDYLQLMSGTKRNDSRVNEVSEITRNLKIMAKELNVPVITLSQLARGSERRTDHRPVLSDLRDSGSIEQDADIVLFLYRDDYYSSSDVPDDDVDKNSCECIVAKNRHGGLLTIPMHWQAEFMQFSSVEVIRREE